MLGTSAEEKSGFPPPTGEGWQREGGTVREEENRDRAPNAGRRISKQDLLAHEKRGERLFERTRAKGTSVEKKDGKRSLGEKRARLSDRGKLKRTGDCVG